MQTRVWSYRKLFDGIYVECEVKMAVGKIGEFRLWGYVLDAFNVKYRVLCRHARMCPTAQTYQNHQIQMGMQEAA
jgi:hypothetical protein